MSAISDNNFNTHSHWQWEKSNERKEKKLTLKKLQLASWKEKTYTLKLFY